MLVELLGPPLSDALALPVALDDGPPSPAPLSAEPEPDPAPGDGPHASDASNPIIPMIRLPPCIPVTRLRRRS